MRTVQVRYNQTTVPLPVTDRELGSYVAAPVTGGTPAMYFSAPQYTGYISWSPSPSGVFLFATEYTAALTLSPAAGYLFEGIPAEGGFTHSRSVSVTHPAGAADKPLTVIIGFPQTGLAAVTDLNLTAYIAAPAPGGTPVTVVDGRRAVHGDRNLEGNGRRVPRRRVCRPGVHGGA